MSDAEYEKVAQEEDDWGLLMLWAEPGHDWRNAQDSDFDALQRCLVELPRLRVAAFRDGATAMREAAAKELQRIDWTMHGHVAHEAVTACADAIRALPLPEPPK